MTWSININGLVTLKPLAGSILVDWPTEVVNPPLKLRMENAVRISQEMVQGSINSLRKYLLLKDSIAGDQPLSPANAQVVDALAKYFGLIYSKDGHKDYWRDVEGVIAVYQKIFAGISARYTIVFYINSLLKQGYVMMTDKKGTSLEELLNSSAPLEHTNFVSSALSDIHLNLAWCRKLSTKDEEVARTIVHEASHKWSNTNDILYKTEYFEARKGGVLKDMIAVGELAPIPRAQVRQAAKPLYTMTGLEKLKARQLLQNADSYAWCAARLWKKASRLI